VALVAVDAVVALVAEVALPLRVAVIVPALKFPDASLATMVLAVLIDVAVVAELGMLLSPAPEPLNCDVAVIVVPVTDVGVVAPIVALLIVPPVMATLFAFCVAIVPKPEMSALGIAADAVSALVPDPLT
ncbi:MAG: hypothetical protein EBT15_12770, partial [Betaproteobacteria bacterium]|nr:hypothetical protein [Betaproteobacteria bacterium]